MKKHGHRNSRIKSRTYQSWATMKDRCLNKNKENYQYYGGRGIRVSEAWLKFEGFLADMGERPIGMTLDRIDPNKNYEVSNCRWATALTQGRNKRKK